VRHHRPDAYSAEQVLLNKRQIYGGAPKLHWYLACSDFHSPASVMLHGALSRSASEKLASTSDQPHFAASHSHVHKASASYNVWHQAVASSSRKADASWASAGRTSKQRL